MSLDGGEPVLQVHDAEMRFGGVLALGGVSLSVRPGEVCGLVGPNGSGKSTLINVISGFVAPTAGRVELAGRDITDLPPEAIARLDIRRTFQRPRFNEMTTSLENIVAAIKYSSAWKTDRPEGSFFQRRRAEEKAAMDALELVGAAEFCAWRASALSHGSRRKVEFARAVVGRPRVLLLDEPTSGVSQAHADLMRDQIFQQRDLGVAVVLVDHDLNFVEGTCSRVVVMDAGRAIFEGAPEEAFADPRVVEAYVGV